MDVTEAQNPFYLVSWSVDISWENDFWCVSVESLPPVCDIDKPLMFLDNWGGSSYMEEKTPYICFYSTWWWPYPYPVAQCSKAWLLADCNICGGSFLLLYPEDTAMLVTAAPATGFCTTSSPLWHHRATRTATVSEWRTDFPFPLLELCPLERARPWVLWACHRKTFSR